MGFQRILLLKTDFSKPTPPPQLKPMEPPKPTIPKQVQPPITPTQPTQPMPMPMGTSTKPPIQALTQPSTTLKAPTPPSQVSQAQPIQAEPYPNKIDVNILQQQIGGIVLKPVIDDTIGGGRVRLNSSIIQNLGIGPGMLVGWEDPLTRAKGSARVEDAPINASEIHMSRDTKEDTNIQSQYIVVYSAEPPIQKVSEITLEVQSQPNLMGYCLVSPRIGLSLDLEKDDIVAFEDELTGATAAGKIEIVETVPDNVIIIDSEILEASGIGSFEVKVMKNHRPIVPLQKISLGITPITGENVWEIVSSARENITSLKAWLENYIIFKGIKLRWSAVNIACSVLNTVPDLTGDVFAQVTQNTTINLTPMGLIPFNAILIIDISRSMMARDVLATNIAPAIEGIKAAMESREIQDFLKHFKPNINVPRRIAAAFAAVLFLSEKVGRGFGEKVAVIRFADEAQILPFENSFYMDSASGKKGVLEDAARMIVDRIANAYGQATNMGAALLAAHQILNEFEKDGTDYCTVLVTSAPFKVINDYTHIFENLKIEVKSIYPRPAAIQAAYRRMVFRPGRDLVINVAYDLTQMAFLKNGILEFIRNVSIGSRNLEVTIHEPESEAEKKKQKTEKSSNLDATENPSLLRDRLRSKIDDLKNKQNPVLHTFFSEILRSLAFIQGRNINNYIERIFITGYGVRKESLIPYLRSRLNMPVFVLTPQLKETEKRTVKYAGFFTTLGNALQERKSFNLLDKKYKIRKVIKKINFLLIFICILLAFSLGYISYKQAAIINQKKMLIDQYSLEYRQLNPIEDLYKNLKEQIKQVNQKNSELYQYVKEQPPIIKVLQFFSNETPRSIRLEQIKFNKLTPDTKGKKDAVFENSYEYQIDLSGVIKTEPLLGDVALINYINKLIELKFFKRVELLNKLKDPANKITKFDVRMYL